MSAAEEVLCAGIIVADHICTPISHVPKAGELVMADKLLLTIGGCAANAAVDLTKMGVRAAVVGRVGGDMFGKVVTEMLREEQVGVDSLLVSEDAQTSQTLIVNVAGEDRRFIHTFGANARFRAADIPLDRVKKAKALYVGGYLAMPEMNQLELVPVFTAARNAGVKTVLDVVVPPGGENYVRDLEQLLPVTDVFLPNNLEAQLITGERDPVRQAEAFQRLGAGTTVITMGGEGAVLVNAKTKLRAGVFSVSFLDGSGGGDAFDAGFIYGLLRGLDEANCLRVASALGASCVRAIGTTPGVFTRSECESFLQEHVLRVESI